jgi:filamentous hemagglutinin family protein
MAYWKRSASLLTASLLAAGHVAANPTAPTVTHGSATFSGSGNTFTVQNTPGTIINWQSFGISTQEVMRFLQQSGSSAVLNRVTGATSSTILGQLQSNGRVFLVNPNGVVFGGSAQVNTTSFTATTGQVADSSFLAGNTTPAGGATLTVSGSFSGSVSLTGTTATISELTSSGDLSIYTGTSGTFNSPNVRIVNTGAATGSGGVTVVSNGNITVANPSGGIAVSGGNVVLTSTGANTAGGGIITVAPPSGVTTSGGGTSVGGGVAAAAPGPAALSTSTGNLDQDGQGSRLAPSSSALMVLQKREPLF